MGPNGHNRMKVDTTGHDQQDSPHSPDQQDRADNSDQQDRPDADDQQDDDQRRKNLGTSPGRGKAPLSGGISTSRAPGSARVLYSPTPIQ